MHNMGKIKWDRHKHGCVVNLIQLHLCVSIEIAKPELVEAMEGKQSQILDRLLKKSLHHNQVTLQKVRKVCILFLDDV